MTAQQPSGHVFPAFTNANFLPNRPPPTTTSQHQIFRSPTPSTRLSGEPAFCAGRHCCHWLSNGHPCNNHYPSAAALDVHICTDHVGRTSSTLHPSPSNQSTLTADYHCHWAGCTAPSPFTNKPKLVRHIHSHTNHKPHLCSHTACNRSFVTKEQLKNHETTHTKAKKFVCGICGKGFAVKTALTSHENVHRGWRPYVCEECGKAFADSSNLSKHRGIHRRAAMKHDTHGRKSSVELSVLGVHDTAIAAVSQQPEHFATPSHLPPLPRWAAPSLEKFPLDYCAGRPCFDAQCEAQDRIPCRSVSPCVSAPCSNRGCSMPPCDLQECPLPDACVVQPCDSLDCALPDCDWADCNFDDCELQHCHLAECEVHDCSGHSQCCVEELASLSTPSTNYAAPATPVVQARAMHAHPAALCDGQLTVGTDCDFSAGFQRLRDFVHGVDCGCAADEPVR